MFRLSKRPWNKNMWRRQSFFLYCSLAATQREGKTEREDWEEAILTSLYHSGQRIRIWFKKKQFTCWICNSNECKSCKHRSYIYYFRRTAKTLYLCYRELSKLLSTFLLWLFFFLVFVELSAVVWFWCGGIIIIGSAPAGVEISKTWPADSCGNGVQPSTLPGSLASTNRCSAPYYSHWFLTGVAIRRDG